MTWKEPLAFASPRHYEVNDQPLLARLEWNCSSKTMDVLVHDSVRRIRTGA